MKMKICTLTRLMVVLAIMSLAAQVQAAVVYLNPDACNGSNPTWKVWTWASGQQGYWVTGTQLDNGLIEFNVDEDNLQFVRLSTNGETEWNRTGNLQTTNDAIYRLTGYNGSVMNVEVTPCVHVYLDPSAVTQSGNVWYAWSFPSGGNGSWYGPISQSNGKYEFLVPTSNGKIIFVRMNANGAPSWNDGVKLNQTNDLDVEVGGTYVITSLGTDRMVGDWASQSQSGTVKTLAELAAEEYYLPDEWVVNDVELDGEYIAVHYIDSRAMLILRSRGENDADQKWNHNENDEFYQNLRADGYDFHVYKKSSLYQQNNWVALSFPQLTTDLLDIAKDLEGHYVSNIKGKLNVKNSFDICLELTNQQLNAIVKGDEVTEHPDTVINTYSVPFFDLHDMGRIYNDNMRNATKTGNEDYEKEGPQFMTLAKPNEVCTLQWAILGYDNTDITDRYYYFEAPAKRIVNDPETGELDLVKSSNIFNLQGKVRIDFTYMPGYNPEEGVSADDRFAGDNNDKLFTVDSMHTVLGLVKTVARTVKSPQWGPRRINAEPDQFFGVETKDWDIEYVFCPLEAPTQKYNPVTRVEAVFVERKVNAVTYYNLAGQSASKPFAGINIVKTTYSDGTSSVIKQLMK